MAVAQATVAQLAARALRKLGVAVVAQANLPADTPATVTITDLAAQALRAIGINPIAQSSMTQSSGVTHTQAEMADLALQLLQVNPGGFAEPDGVFFGLSDIATRALIFLNVYASDETPSADDAAQALNWTQSFHNDVLSRGYGAWSSTAIPAGVANLYAIGVASQLAPAYEKPADPQGYAGAMNGIKAMGNAGGTAHSYASDHIGQIHQMLIGKNLANWALSAVPDAVVEYYCTLAAQEMGPAFGVPFDPAAYNGALAGMRRYSLSGTFGQTIAQVKVTQVHEEMMGRSLVTWLPSAIPVGLSEAYVQMAAFLLEPMLGRAPDQPQLFTQQVWDAAITRVEIYTTVSGSQSLAEQVLRGIHAEWRVRGMTRWEILDIPREMEESYVCATASRLGPQFPPRLFPGGSFDPKWEQWAEMQLWRMIQMRSTGLPVMAEYF
jgi:hypothetical protein